MEREPKETEDMMYQQTIRQEIARQGKIGVDPRHIEGYIRLGHDALDSLTPQQWSKEVSVGLACLAAEGTDAAERNARSLNL